MEDAENTEVTWNLVGYARVSTDDQNLDLQLRALKKAGVPDTQVFKEHVSGVASNRPEFKKALKHLRRGDKFVVWKFDRLGRSIKELVTLFDDLKERGVEIYSLTEKVDTTSAMGKMFFNFMAMMAQFERDLISERTKAGLEAAKARGTWKARKPSITEKQWDAAVELLKENPALSPYFLAKDTSIPAFKGKRPSKSTWYNYMDLLLDDAPYPWADS